MFVCSRSQGCIYSPGTLLEVWSARYGVNHRGIAGHCQWDGSQEVVHARKDRGVYCSTLFEFAEGQIPKVVLLPQSIPEQHMILHRAYSQIGHPYHLLIANCEHFANWAATGLAYSDQVTRAGTVAFGTFFLAVAIMAADRD